MSIRRLRKMAYRSRQDYHCDDFAGRVAKKKQSPRSAL